MKSRYTHLTLSLYLCAGAFIGLLFPAIFIYLDLKQLQINYSTENIYSVFRSQNIYIFSSIAFPSLFAIIAGLFYKTRLQRDKLKDHENYLKNVMDSLNDGIIVCDEKGKINYANWMFYQHYHSNFKNLESFLNIKNLKEIEAGFNKDHIVINSNSEEKIIHYAISKLNSRLESIANEHQYIISITDVDELRKNKQTLEAQTAQLYEATKLSALGQMATGFAHEINNPLAVINGRIDICNRELKKVEIDDQVISKNLDVCKQNILRITKIITGLKNLSHSDVGNIEIVTLKALVEDALMIVNLKLSGKDINFYIEYSGLENETIMCNPIQLSQVLMNLFGNAIDEIEKHEKPWLSFKVIKTGENYIFTIMDSGPGIPMEIQNKMFNPMFTTKPIGSGTGLGLSISRAIVEKHQGTIRINNDVPNTCFEIVIPKKLRLYAAA